MAAVGATAGALALRCRVALPSVGEAALRIAAGLMSAGIMTGVHFVPRSDFKWVLLAPFALWVAAEISLLQGARRLE